MPAAPQILPEEVAIRRIVDTIARSDPGEAPFALVLGSGFSHGLVPTARELVTESLPLWIKCLKENKTFESQKDVTPEECAAITGAFWREFVEGNASLGLNLELNMQGIPLDYAAAYQAAFDSRYSGAVGHPAPARKFQRALMKLDQPRLNAAHFLLASILGAQPGKSGQSSLFKFRCAFSRLILTTNFDPFLQTALQAVNRLYFMSDTPNLGVGDELFDDHTDAIHLVYLHGSIHRRAQAANQQDISELKLKNARSLAPVLKRRGIIVLGYSGWDDALVEALDACDRFDHGLYWCGLRPDPLGKDAFGQRVPDILCKPSACYVPTTGAGAFMAKLLNRLVKGLPRLLENPIGQLREMLTAINLKEIENLETTAANAVSTSESIVKLDSSTFSRGTFAQAHGATLQNLARVERIFLGEINPQPLKEPTKTQTSTKKVSGVAVKNAPNPKQEEQVSRVQRIISHVALAEGLGNYSEVHKLCDEGLQFSEISAGEKAELLLHRGRASYFMERIDQALSDWSQVVELHDVPVAQLALAICNRGIAWGKRNEPDKEIADYTRLIDALPGAPVMQVAIALRNRGIAWGKKNEPDKEIADYTRLIDALPGAPIEHVAPTLINRGIVWGKKDEPDKQIADYTRLIDALPGAPVEHVARALNNRAVAWGKKNELDKQIADYTRLIDALPGAPIEQVARALNNRGVAWGKKNELDKQIADYTRLIDALPGASVEQIALALNNRSVAWGKKNEPDKQIADYAQLIDALPGAPVEHVARAQGARGWFFYKQNKFADFLSDTRAALQKCPALSFVAFNLGLALLANGSDTDALAAYRQAAEQFPKEIDAMGLADVNEATGKWLTPERAQPILQLLESLKKNPPTLS